MMQLLFAAHPIRQISPGFPITAVRLGAADDLACRQAEVRAAWKDWGILDNLLHCEAWSSQK